MKIAGMKACGKTAFPFLYQWNQRMSVLKKIQFKRHLSDTE